jgi:hypothetical protein
MSKLYVDKMYPKSTGQGITQPNLIGFTAKGNSIGAAYSTLTAYGGSGTVIKFGSSADTSNSGYPGFMEWNSGDYDPTTGIFIAPAAGKYHLSMNIGILKADQNEQIYPHIYKNNASYQYAYYNNTVAATQYVHASFSLCLLLAANDEIKIQIEGTAAGEFYGGPSENHYSIYFVG